MPVDPVYLNAVKDDAITQIVARVTGVDDELSPDGLSYFDDKFATEADFLMWFLGLRDYSDPQWGQHLDLTKFLPQIAPKLWAQWVQRYQKAIAKHVLGAA